MVARNSKPKKSAAAKSAAAPTRELFSDSVSAAETQTTRPPNSLSATRPAYLGRPPVKFINVRVGSFFLLNGGRWEKVSYDYATNHIPVMVGGVDSGRTITGATVRMNPAEFVFLLDSPVEAPSPK